jgi:hypothetical protein
MMDLVTHRRARCGVVADLLVVVALDTRTCDCVELMVYSLRPALSVVLALLLPIQVQTT